MYISFFIVVWIQRYYKNYYTNLVKLDTKPIVQGRYMPVKGLFEKS